MVKPKRRRTSQSINWKLCIFCQVYSGKASSKGGAQGITRVQEEFAKRLHHGDIENTSSQGPHIEDLTSKGQVWHKGCYALFTSRHNLLALETQHVPEQNPKSTTSSTGSDEMFKRAPPTREEVGKVEWNKCTFCQSCRREKTIQVQMLPWTLKW